MGKKVPVVVYVDPEVESALTIKPFAAGLAAKAANTEGATGTASATGTNVTGQAPDVDADADADF